MDSIDFLRRARRLLFLQIQEGEFLLVQARDGFTSVEWWIAGGSQPIQAHRIDCPAEELGLFNGYAWNAILVTSWIRRHCPVCWRPLTDARQKYDHPNCRQKAYRERVKMKAKLGLYQKAAEEYDVIHLPTGEHVAGAFVFLPQSDLHARRGILAYADSLEFENPRRAQELREWVGYLNLNYPMRTQRVEVGSEAYDEFTRWIKEQEADKHSGNN